MVTSLEGLRVLQEAEAVADGIWQEIIGWEPFAREVVGGQLARAADSIGANIAEAFGRFHYGEKLQFLYYARGSLFETKYWLNRAAERGLMRPDEAQQYASRLTTLARQLNAFAGSLKAQRDNTHEPVKTLREPPVTYMIGKEDDVLIPLFSEADLEWLQLIPISNL